MKIIISPAKKMNVDMDTLNYRSVPALLSETEKLLQWLRGLTFEKAKNLWKCNDRIAEQNYRRIQEMDLKKNLTPAVIAYEGIQYQYMAPAVFDKKETDYIQDHLRILSGFYGVLRPFDGIVPYRLEMQSKASDQGDLYRFWGERIYREITEDTDHIIINLASREYSRCVEKYLRPDDLFLTVIFGELSEGKVKQKGTYAKMARGEMVRFLAEKNADTPESIKKFDRLGYHFDAERSTEKQYVFLKAAADEK